MVGIRRAAAPAGNGTTDRAGRPEAGSDRIDELDPDALVDAALQFVARDPDPADLAGVGNVGAAVGLEVEAHDLDGPDLLDALAAAGSPWSG